MYQNEGPLKHADVDMMIFFLQFEKLAWLMSRSKKRFLLDRYISISVNFKLRFHGFAEQFVDGSNFPASDGHPWELIQDVRLFGKEGAVFVIF